MSRIMIVEDDENISNMLSEVLPRAGYDVMCAYSGTEALLLLEKTRPDLILLDLMLPGLPGEEVLPKLAGIPVIITSAKADTKSKIDMLTDGAADYITKPFDTGELLARIAARLRERKKDMPSGIYSRGGLTIDTISHSVLADGNPVSLTRTEYAILKLLMQNPEQVIAKSVLLDRISADTPDCTESSLKTHISHLRGKLREASDKDYIESVWGIGFKLNA